MNRALLRLAVAFGAALLFAAAFRGLDAVQPERYAGVPDEEEVQQAGFERHPTDYAAERKLPSAKPLWQGLFGTRKDPRPRQRRVVAEPSQNNRASTPQPQTAAGGSSSVPRRIRREAPIDEPQVEVGQPPQEIANQAVAPEVDRRASVQPLDPPAGLGVSVDPTTSSRRVQPVAEADQPPPAPLEAIAPEELSGSEHSQPIDGQGDLAAGGPTPIAADEAPVPIPAPAAAGGPAAVPAAERPDERLLVSRRSAVLVVETLGPRQIVIGKEATFQVKLQNLGDVAAMGVEVRVQTPAGAEITGANPSRGSTGGHPVQGQPLIWNVVSLPARGTEVLDLQILPRQSNAFDLSVAWTMQPDASQTMIEVQEPQLQLAIAGPTEVLYGDTQVYQLTIANPGTGDAENVQVQLMPIEGGDQPMAVQDVGTIAAGAKRQLELELTARQAGHIHIDATATADLGLEARASEKVLVRRASLTVDVIGPAAKYTGTMAEYKFRVANPGNAPAEHLEIVAQLPPGCEYVESTNGGRLDKEAHTLSWTVDELAPDREMVFSVQVTLQQPGSNMLNVTAKADRELADSGGATTIVETLADLKLEISDPRGPLPVNEDTVYELRLWNRGSKAARDIEVVVFFSEGVEPVSAQGGTHRLAPGQVVFNAIPSLGVDDEIKFKIVARATRPGNHVFRTEVQCQDAGTRLAAEETTHFYDSQILTARPQSDSGTIRR